MSGTPLEERVERERMVMIDAVETSRKWRNNAQTLWGKCTNMYRSGRGSKYESHGRKIKGSTGKWLEIFRENKRPSTGTMDEDHFGTEEVIRGSWKYVGSTKDPPTTLRTTASRSIEGDRELATMQGKVKQEAHETKEKLMSLTTQGVA
jgi:hypothetical protein